MQQAGVRTQLPFLFPKVLLLLLLFSASSYISFPLLHTVLPLCLFSYPKSIVIAPLYGKVHDLAL